MKNRGAILVVVMVLTALSSVVAASLLFRMHAEVAASGAAVGGEQAYSAAYSGIRRAMSIVANDPYHTDWYDNPSLLHNQLVADDGVCRWYFTIYAHNPSDPGNLRFGLTDQAAHIDVNAADEDILAAIPNMTAELVDALLDYRDSDDTPRPQGAEQDYYGQLAYPYLIPNGPLGTVEELLMVRGFTGPVVYGEDANLNGLLDPNEDDGGQTFPPDDGDGVLDRGMLGVLAVDVSAPNIDSDGNPRVNMLTAEREELEYAGLSDQTIDYIMVIRAESSLSEATRRRRGIGEMPSHPAELLEAEYEVTQDHEELDLQAGDVIYSGVGADELADVLDRLTCTDEETLTGLVNVNTAPAAVLAALMGGDEFTARRIVDYRAGLGDIERLTPAWLYAQGVVDAERFVELAPMLTTRSNSFHVRCLGFGVPCGRFRVLEAIIDVSDTRPRITYLRDITRLGLPFVPDADELRRGG